MNSNFLHHRRLRWINLPGTILMILLQRTPALSLVATEEIFIASPVGAMLKSVAAAVAALGAVNTLVGATPLVPSTGTASGITVTAGDAVSIFYTVNGTQTPPKSWHVAGTVPAGLNFSGLTATGSVDVGSLHLAGTPTTAGVYPVTLQTFEFVGTGGSGSPVYNYTITVTGAANNSAPSFTTQPVSQTIGAGQAVSFTTAASGTPAPTYQWQKGATPIAGATNTTLTIASVVAGDAGDYTVIATNAQGSVTSNVATLTVSATTAAPTFTAQPTSQAATVGNGVTFTATGSPAPTYQWKKGTTNIAGATNNTLSIASVAAGDAGDYTVVATNAQGSVTSNVATLTVSATTAAPTFTAQPTSQAATVGTGVTFTAAASGSPVPTYQWKKGTTNIAGATNNTLSLASVAAGDAGDYTVVATNSAGSATSAIATLTISTAPAAPSFTTQPANQAGSAGSNVTFIAAAGGTPTPTYQWQKGGVAIAGATNSSLVINGIITADAGNYTVVATNSQGSVTSNIATLTVGIASPNQLTNNTVTTGHKVSFWAGNTPGALQWQVSTNNGGNWSNLANDSTYSGTTSSTLLITNATAALNGFQYRYVATNSGVVATSNAATLSVAQAFLPFPTCVVVDASGNLYVGDANANTIQKITPSGQISLLAGQAGTAGFADGTGASARFNMPAGIALGTGGVIFVADTSNAIIRRIATDGAVTTFAGSATTRGSADGAGTAATFSSPNGIAIDAGGNLYVADSMNNTIRKITSTGTVTTFAGNAGSTGVTNGNETSARFNLPTGLVIDNTGNLYISDTTNNTIRKITPAGDVSTLAGLEGVSGAQDGAGPRAYFNHPGGLAIDGTGNLYVADTGNSIIRKITPAGVVTTVAGLAGIAGLLDGAGVDSYFNQPLGLGVDAAGNLYVTDTGNAALRKIIPALAVKTMSLSAATTPTPIPPSNPSPPPVPSSSGGGGGSVSDWFAGVIAILCLVRRLKTKPVLNRSIHWANCGPT